MDFTSPSFTGDYMAGTSYKTGDGWEFFLSWDVCGNVRFANVFVPAVPPKPDAPVLSVAARTRVGTPPTVKMPPGAFTEIVGKLRAIDSTQPCQ
ncbi:MAG TPA: hypothetical protein VF736_17570 [Pyrinomonadaceae bacterium]|jgi:hypothetical protein